MGELARTCIDYPEQCTTFLEASNCQPVWLGFDPATGEERVAGGYAEVFEWDPASGSCVVDTQEIAALCGGDAEQCIDLITVAGCPPGWYDHDLDMSTGCMPCSPGQFSPARASQCTDCRANWADTDRNPATPCQRCANGFDSIAGSVECTSALTFCPATVFLGPTVGYEDVRVWRDDSCIVDSTLFDAACGPACSTDGCTESATRQECLAFLSSDGSECQPAYLGENIGWAMVTGTILCPRSAQLMPRLLAKSATIIRQNVLPTSARVRATRSLVSRFMLARTPGGQMCLLQTRRASASRIRTC